MTDHLLAALPEGVRSRHVEDINGLSMHVLEAGDPSAPMVLLLHGFPELAFSWRHTLPAIAEAGYHVVAPDQRGYGRTTGWASGYDVDLEAFAMPALVRDALRLVWTLGRTHVAAVIGHEIGHVTARHSVEQMSQQQLAQIGIGVAAVASEDFRPYAG